MTNSHEPDRKAIKVHLLNYYGVTSHVEICLEYSDINEDGILETKYLTMNRWAAPTPWLLRYWQQFENADEKISFEINADPNIIYTQWHQYWYDSAKNSSIVGNNCAVASQWFLTKYCNIPEPCTSGLNINHMALGVCWPSFIHCPILLPGRVFDNAQFYLATKDDKKRQDKNVAQILKQAISFLLKILVGVSIFVLDIAAIALLFTFAINMIVIYGAIMGSKSMIDYFNYQRQNNNREYRYHAPSGC